MTKIPKSLIPTQRALSGEYDFTCPETGEHFEARSVAGPYKAGYVRVMLRGNRGRWLGRALIGAQVIAEATSTRRFDCAMQLDAALVPFCRAWYQRFVASSAPVQPAA